MVSVEDQNSDQEMYFPNINFLPLALVIKSNREYEDSEEDHWDKGLVLGGGEDSSSATDVTSEELNTAEKTLAKAKELGSSWIAAEVYEKAKKDKKKAKKEYKNFLY